MTLVDSCIADVPCGAVAALVIPLVLMCVLGLMELLFDRPQHKNVEDMTDAEWYQELDDHEDAP